MLNRHNNQKDEGLRIMNAIRELMSTVFVGYFLGVSLMIIIIGLNISILVFILNRPEEESTLYGSVCLSDCEAQRVRSENNATWV